MIAKKSLAVPDSQRQTCKLCHRIDGFNFSVPDDIWDKITPSDLRGNVLCLLCFDKLALAAHVDYSASISDVMFVGDAAYFAFDIRRRLWSA